MQPDNGSVRSTIIVYTALTGALVGGSLAFLISRHLWQPSTKARASLSTSHDKKQSPSTAAESTSSMKDFLKDDVLSEQLARNIAFFGPESQQKIADAFVIVVGLGGVGSHAAHLLLRSGVGKLRLIDFDQVTLSSLNRHAVATREDVGTPKALCLDKHFKRITPEVDLECLVEMYLEESEERLLAGAPHFVLDAIDNLDTKASLIAACKRRGLKILSVAGAGAKADPTRLRVVDMSEASMDPLSKAVRQKLRTAHNVWGGIPVLLSLEKPRCKLVTPDNVDETQLLNYQVIPNFRVRTIPVLGTSPSIFGMAAASYVLCNLAGPSHIWDGEPTTRPLSKEYERLLKELRDREVERFGDQCPFCPLDLDDVIFLVRELWRGFSARHMARTVVPGGDKGITRSVANLTLSRWDQTRPPSVDNVILLTYEEARIHEETSLDSIAENEPEFYSWVQRAVERTHGQYLY